MARKCLEEIINRDKESKVISKWEEERKLYFEEKSMSVKEVESRKEQGGKRLGRISNERGRRKG